MEDTHVLQVTDDGILAAVFDGHCGPEVATMGAELFPKTFAAQRSLGQSPGEALKWTLAGLHAQSVGLPSGACVVAAYVDKDAITVANLGDAHAVLVRRNGDVSQLSEDHRLSNPAELSRIYELGTPIQKPYYYAMSTNGPAGLMPTRTIGDHGLTSAGCLAEPHIRKVWLSLPDLRPEWLILGCDGLFDVVEANELFALLQGVETPDDAAKVLAKEALEVRKTTDNLTICAIKL